MAYFGASTDKVEANRDFAQSLGLDYPLLSDPDGDVAEAYGVRGFLGFASRWTFYIGKDGKILRIDSSVNPSTAGADVARQLGELGIPKR